MKRYYFPKLRVSVKTHKNSDFSYFGVGCIVNKCICPLITCNKCDYRYIASV